MKENRNILDQLRETDTVNPTTWGVMHDTARKFGWDVPETRAARIAASERGPQLIARRTGKALDQTYKHLDQPLGTPYEGLGFKYGNNLRYNPFSGQETTLALIRNNFGKNAPWLANVPEDNPINSFTKRLYGENDIAEMPEFRHIFDVMGEDMAAGRLTPQQLKSGSFSVEAAARRAAEYNAEKIKAMEKTKLIEAEGFPTVKQYDTGYKWLDLKHNDSNDATRRALKEEGDAMGHCVGGYCDQVLGGRTKILSLRNPKGQPRVTVELRMHGEGPDWQIQQIKGPTNRKPSAAEIPMIQDFIKNNGPFYGDIGDAHNADLIDTRTLRSQLKSFIEDNGYEASDLPESDLIDWLKQTEKEQGHNYIPKNLVHEKYKELGGDPNILP